MIRDLLKWVAPGVVTVLGGTAAALAFATPAMVGNLESQGREVLASDGYYWAHFTISGRQLTLSGTTFSDTERDLVIQRLAGLPGVAGVEQIVTVAPLATPYRINVAVEDRGVSLYGSVPNEELRQSLASRPGLVAADLQIRSGQPDEAQWLRGVEFALSQAQLVTSGHFELSGLTLNATGQASSERALGHLQMALAALPSGIAKGQIAVEPVRITPYVWRADYDGHRIAISGYVPEEQIVDRLRLADVSGVPIATGLSLASGAPAGFAEQARRLVEQLARLEEGEGRIVDGVSRLTGVPPSLEVAQAVTEALSGPNSIVELQPPRIADYWVSINRQPGNVLVFDGYVPDETTRSKFADLDGADVSFLKFGAGAPAGYHGAVDFGLELLAHLSEGRFALAGDAVSLSGIAQSPADYRMVRSRLESALPQGLILGEAAVQAPPAAAYNFTIRRDETGAVILSGMLPAPEVETELLSLAGPSARSKVTYASGEAPNFVASAEQAMQFLPWLRQGEIRFDGTGWSVTGEPASVIDKGSIEAEFAVQGLAQAGWSLALTSPKPAPVAADPFVWSAERLADGSFLFQGNVPATALQDYLKVHVGTRVTDTSRVALGAPDNFALQVNAAVDALLALEQGRVAFDGKSWSLSGTAASGAARQASLDVAAPLDLAAGAEVVVPEPVDTRPYVWSASKSATGAIVFEGFVPAESLQRFLAVRGGETAIDNTEVRTGAPAEFSLEVLQALDVLALIESGEVAFDGASWTANGNIAAAERLADAEAALGTALPKWSLALSAPAVEPAEPATPPEEPVQAEAIAATSEEAPPPAAASSNLALCEARLAELSAHNAILFQSGAAIISASASAELDAFAEALALCPNAVIDVEGHTDSDGDDQRNLALSVARAEAVVNALIERGVAPERLYAIGYGEAKPVADNATAAGKRQNRRIVVSVRAAGGEG
ncbi:OmpA family protein [uncultured Devosia sp.]|uniref:OmpA family protein n=1 Tax=uncultured Devosia sp. TaxID=211434 RepID=UPI0026210825|nr:OmpA family protein [uncultured Devosia sp.]